MSLADWIIVVSAVVLITALIIKFRKPIACWFVGCDWTTRHQEGEAPTEAELAAGVAGFFHYAQMWCKRCGRRHHI